VIIYHNDNCALFGPVKVRYNDFTTLARQFSVRETITEGVRHLPTALVPAAAGETGFVLVAVAGFERQQSAQAEPAAAHTPVNWKN
jgi:hypothetical protein